ncbi:MAG: hypothetical protein LBT88_01880 [Oscillospiraceae bacterium]|jgi:hypothetical protein|nr:hypothetical protein [Oscillospiraceae bacterium]
MKLKAIANVCKINNTVIIFNASGGGQWISNGHAVYKLDGVRPLEAKDFLTLFDIPSDKRDAWTCETQDETSSTNLNLENDCAGESFAKLLPLSFTYLNQTYCGFTAENERSILVRHELIKPFMPFCEYTQFYVRHRQSDEKPYLVVKDGLLISGVVLPAVLPANDEAFHNALADIARAARSS